MVAAGDKGRRLAEFSADDFEKIFEKCMLQEGLQAFSLPPFPARFAALTSLLLEANQEINLTAIRSVGEICLKHYADCLKLAEFLPEGASLLDVGCGGGFPSLPLAIVRPDLRITALDSVAKKLRFVERCKDALSLGSLTTLYMRAEEAGRSALYREKFDVVTARAVASLELLAEWCLPLVRKGGIFLAMKGSGGAEELENAASRLIACGGRADSVCRFRLGDMDRTIITVRKTAVTPAIYPRRNAKKKR